MVLGTTILSNGKGHFGPTDQDNRTGQSGPPSKLVVHIAGRTKLKWSIPFDVPTKFSGILG